MTLASTAFAGGFFTTMPPGNGKHRLTILYNNSASRYVHNLFENVCPYNASHMNCLYVICYKPQLYSKSPRTGNH